MKNNTSRNTKRTRVPRTSSLSQRAYTEMLTTRSAQTILIRYFPSTRSNVIKLMSFFLKKKYKKRRKRKWKDRNNQTYYLFSDIKFRATKGTSWRQRPGKETTDLQSYFGSFWECYNSSKWQLFAVREIYQDQLWEKRTYYLSSYQTISIREEQNCVPLTNWSNL